MLSRKPLHSLAVVSTLALGIGVNSAIFSVVHAALIQPVYYPRADRLVSIRAASPADFLAWREQVASFERFGGYMTFGTVDLTGGGEPERLRCHLVTADFFPALGVEAAYGRTFFREEERPGHDRVVVLSHALWQRRFDADTSVLGRSLTLDGASYAVVGVMPRHFGTLGGRADVWAPLSFGPHRPADRNSVYVGTIARLAPGVSLGEARAEMATISRRLERQYPETNTGRRAVVRPLSEVMVGNIRPTMLLLVAAAGFVLLIACVNVSNLLLARGVARHQEFCLRTALGATRGRLLGQLLAESLILSLTGAVFGLMLAFLAVELLPDLRGTYTYHHTEIRLNLWAVGLTLGIAFAVGVLAGMVPALRASRLNLSDALGSAGRSAMKSGGSQRLQSLLVVAEIALAFVLLVGAGLLILSLRHLQSADRGFDTAKLLKLEVGVSAERYPQGAHVVAFFDALLTRLGRVPGIEAAAAGNSLPGTGWTFGARVEGQEEDQSHGARWLLVTPGYFRTVGIPVLKGRTFTPEDRLERRPVMILNEKAASSFFSGEDPIGKRVAFDGPQDWHEVIGVVGNVADPVEDEPSRACYVPFYQEPLTMRAVGHSSMVVLLRAVGDPPALAEPVRREVLAFDRDLAVSGLESMERQLARSILRPRMSTVLLTVFAALALALATIGVFSLMAYFVHQRVPEIGIRMALGAAGSSVLGWVLRRGLRLTLAGLGLGLAAGLACNRLIASLVHGVSPLDPRTYFVVASLLGAVAVATCVIPARRAARLDPAVTLRAE